MNYKNMKRILKDTVKEHDRKGYRIERKREYASEDLYFKPANRLSSAATFGGVTTRVFRNYTDESGS